MVDEIKTCNNCKEDKLKSEFYTVNKRGKPTVFHICKSCSSSQKKKMSEYYRDWELRKKYGITLETYKNECNSRDNVCDICKFQVETLHVDHCHSTMRVRGYLCGSCNRALGLLKDSQTSLENAINYLRNNG